MQTFRIPFSWFFVISSFLRKLSETSVGKRLRSPRILILIDCVWKMPPGLASLAKLSLQRPIRVSTSIGALCRFSLLSANTVNSKIPKCLHQRIASSSFASPSAWPRCFSFYCATANLLFPSIIIATDRGICLFYDLNHKWLHSVKLCGFDINFRFSLSCFKQELGHL